MAAASETTTMGKVLGWLGGLGSATFDFTAALKRCRIAIVSAVKGNFAGGHSPEGSAWPPLKHPRPNSRGSDVPLRDKGLLAASVSARNAKGHYELLQPSKLEYGTNLEYAAVHQYGATIRPVGAKFLTIPLTSEAARAGSPRNWTGPPLKPVIYKSGKGTLRDAISGAAQYALVKEVTIPARPFLGWSDDLAAECAEIVADAVGHAVVKMPVSSSGGKLTLAA